MHCRPTMHINSAWRIENERRPAFRLQADKLRSGEHRDLIAPRASGVDDHRRGKRACKALDSPRVALRLEAAHFRVGANRTAALAKSSNEPVVHRMHVEVHRLGLEHRPRDIILAQHRYDFLGLARVQSTDALHKRHPFRCDMIEEVSLVGASDPQHATRLYQWVFRKTLRRSREEGFAPARKRLDYGRPMRLQIKRGRSPRRMVCELALAFEQKDFAMSGELVSRGSARDTAAYDNEIVSIHSLRSGHASAKRSRSFQQLSGEYALMRSDVVPLPHLSPTRRRPASQQKACYGLPSTNTLRSEKSHLPSIFRSWHS